jgi:hypothetical protein
MPGQRSKFHVVGETVEMAMRMERTGIRGKIHCSKTTAAWLRADGMESWLKAREEKIVDRDRGSLHTYWVDPAAANTSTVSPTEFDSFSMVSSVATAHEDDYSACNSSTSAIPIRRLSGSPSIASIPNERRDLPIRRPSGAGSVASVPTERRDLPIRRLSGAGSVASAPTGRRDRYKLKPSVASTSAIMFRDKQSLKPVTNEESKDSRLIEWNVDVLSRLLRNIVAKRTVMGDSENISDPSSNVNASKYLAAEGESISILKEVKEKIEMPEMEAKIFFNESKVDAESIELSPLVMAQLRAFVMTIETMYHNHPYHNFEHASHVGMSLAVLLSRLANNDQEVFMTLGGAIESNGKTSSSHDSNTPTREKNNDGFMKALSHHNRTFGISSDPLAQFALVFAALAHEVDHPGAPNRVLIREFSPLVKTYQGRCMAQQHAIQRTWELFSHESFHDLRRAICPTPRELRRFRQIFVTAVMATDFVDREFNERRVERWEQSFNSELLEERMKESQTSLTLYSKVELDRMATLVMEHLMQASVVAHAMQHWQ